MPARKPTPRQPPGLQAAGRELWRSIIPRYQLRPDELAILAEACRTADVVAELDVARAGAPLLSKGHAGQDVIHPFVSELRYQRGVLATLLGRLKLPDEAGGIRRDSAASEQARKAAMVRWRPRDNA